MTSPVRAVQVREYVLQCIPLLRSRGRDLRFELEDILNAHSESPGDSERQSQRGHVSTLLQGADGLAGAPCAVRQGLLALGGSGFPP